MVCIFDGKNPALARAIRKSAVIKNIGAIGAQGCRGSKHNLCSRAALQLCIPGHTKAAAEVQSLRPSQDQNNAGSK